MSTAIRTMTWLILGGLAGVFLAAGFDFYRRFTQMRDRRARAEDANKKDRSYPIDIWRSGNPEIDDPKILHALVRNSAQPLLGVAVLAVATSRGVTDAAEVAKFVLLLGSLVYAFYHEAQGITEVTLIRYQWWCLVGWLLAAFLIFLASS